MSENEAKKKIRTKVYIIIMAAIAISIFVFAIVFKNITDSRAYDKYMEAAQLSYGNSDYDNALSSLRKAEAISSTDECLQLMAQCYELQGNYDKAIETLRLMNTTDSQTASKISSIEDKRREEANADLITIAGSEHRLGETSLVLDGKGLGNNVMYEVVQLYSMSNLSLANNNVTDISPIVSLGGLTTLNLNNNKISDISPLANLSNLRTLYLDNNPITDLSPLYNIKTLTSLSIKGIEISESELELLSQALPNCAINGANAKTEIPVIALGGMSFKSDVTEIDLSGCGISDISALSKCENLNTIILSNNSISDITPLMDIPGIVYLDISNNNITDMRPLMGLNSIKTINASGNNISTTVPVGANTALTELNLSNNPITNFSGLKKLKNLVTLNLASTGLKDSDVKYFKYLTRLNSLNVENNSELSGSGYDQLMLLLPSCGVSHSELVYELSIGGYPVSSNTTEINYPNSGISDISAIMSLANLETIKLSGNIISDLYCFGYTESWRTLKYLDLGDNSITDITPLSHLLQLETLNLSDNNITDASPLYGLSNLRYLYIGGNNLSEYDIYQLETSLPSCIIVSG